jgi:microsomal dipeptidase-like Zn-dependent dipeptidase
MLADLHVHYPMRVVGGVQPRSTLDQMRDVVHRRGLKERLQALAVNVLSRFFSDRSPASGYRVTVDGLRAGGVGVVLSALYRPFDEMDLDKHYQAPPDPSYFARLIGDLEAVEAEVGSHDRATIRLAHDGPELEACLADGATAVVHCVEGGFHLGDSPQQIADDVGELARRGVAYITLAHLFYRQIATNAPAVPFLRTDKIYNTIFPQPDGVGLTERGVAAVRAMVAHRVLIDLSHMSPEAITETLDLLDRELDPGRGVPVTASHAGFRFGQQEYLLDAPTLERIRDRNGVVGLIMAQYQLNDGLRDGHTTSFDESRAIIFQHIDRIVEITGGFDHVAIGTDFDGFIKPTMTGLESAADLGRLEAALRERYGDPAADAMTSGNVLRVLRQGWARP